MRSTFNPVFALATVAAMTLGSASTSLAATVGVTGVTGNWTALLPPVGPTNVNGLNTNTVSWGTPFVGAGGSGQQSSYSFIGEAAGQIETGKNFNLGTFTHNNFVINTGTSIEGANLSVGVNLMIGGVSKAINAAFHFDHDETKNAGEANGLCKNGGANHVDLNLNGCADRVSIQNNTNNNQSFEIDGFLYILEITGFTVAGKLFSEFWTTENAKNSAELQARFTLVGAVPGVPGVPGGGEPVPPPAPVPLPAAGWMILSALGALAATRARRKA